MSTRHVSRLRADPGAFGNAVCALIAGLLLSGAPVLAVLAGTPDPETMPRCAFFLCGVALAIWGGAELKRTRSARVGARSQRGGGR